jgi:hypothetical protein
MAEETLRELNQFVREATDLRDRLAAVQAAAPRHVEGTDPTGAVRMVLGGNGLPTSIWVDPDWLAKLAGSPFSGAVLDAFAAATRARTAAWTHTLDSDAWRYEVGRHGRREHAPTPHPIPDPTPEMLRERARHITPRPLADIVEDVLRALDTADGSAHPSPVATGTGRDPQGECVVTLSTTGLVSFSAREEWVEWQRAATLMDSFARALTAARADLDGAVQAPDFAQRLDRLFDEGMASLYSSPPLD